MIGRYCNYRMYVAVYLRSNNKKPKRFNHLKPLFTIIYDGIWTDRGRDYALKEGRGIAIASLSDRYPISQHWIVVMKTKVLKQGKYNR